MKFKNLNLKGAYIIEAKPYEDARGMFTRLYCENEFKEINQLKKIVQINYSLTKGKGALRGMHYQKPPKAEIKMVRCLSGSIFDVIIDLRKDSNTFLKWHGEVLSSENRRMMYIPEGFAHGFQTLAPSCELLYFHTEFYSQDFEGGVLYDDPGVDIKWPSAVAEITEKDMSYPLLSKEFEGIKL